MPYELVLVHGMLLILLSEVASRRLSVLWRLVNVDRDVDLAM